MYLQDICAFLKRELQLRIDWISGQSAAGREQEAGVSGQKPVTRNL